MSRNIHNDGVPNGVRQRIKKFGVFNTKGLNNDTWYVYEAKNIITNEEKETDGQASLGRLISRIRLSGDTQVSVNLTKDRNIWPAGRLRTIKLSDGITPNLVTDDSATVYASGEQKMFVAHKNVTKTGKSGGDNLRFFSNKELIRWEGQPSDKRNTGFSTTGSSYDEWKFTFKLENGNICFFNEYSDSWSIYKDNSTFSTEGGIVLIKDEIKLEPKKIHSINKVDNDQVDILERIDNDSIKLWRYDFSDHNDVKKIIEGSLIKIGKSSVITNEKLGFLKLENNPNTNVEYVVIRDNKSCLLDNEFNLVGKVEEININNFFSFGLASEKDSGELIMPMYFHNDYFIKTYNEIIYDDFIDGDLKTYGGLVVKGGIKSLSNTWNRKYLNNDLNEIFSLFEGSRLGDTVSYLPMTNPFFKTSKLGPDHIRRSKYGFIPGVTGDEGTMFGKGVLLLYSSFDGEQIDIDYHERDTWYKTKEWLGSINNIHKNFKGIIITQESRIKYMDPFQMGFMQLASDRQEIKRTKFGIEYPGYNKFYQAVDYKTDINFTPKGGKELAVVAEFEESSSYNDIYIAKILLFNDFGFKRMKESTHNTNFDKWNTIQWERPFKPLGVWQEVTDQYDKQKRIIIYGEAGKVAIIDNFSSFPNISHSIIQTPIFNDIVSIQEVEGNYHVFSNHTLVNVMNKTFDKIISSYDMNLKNDEGIVSIASTEMRKNKEILISQESRSYLLDPTKENSSLNFVKVSSDLKSYEVLKWEENIFGTINGVVKNLFGQPIFYGTGFMTLFKNDDTYNFNSFSSSSSKPDFKNHLKLTEDIYFCSNDLFRKNEMNAWKIGQFNLKQNEREKFEYIADGGKKYNINLTEKNIPSLLNNGVIWQTLETEDITGFEGSVTLQMRSEDLSIEDRKNPPIDPNIGKVLNQPIFIPKSVREETNFRGEGNHYLYEVERIDIAKLKNSDGKYVLFDFDLDLASQPINAKFVNITFDAPAGVNDVAFYDSEENKIFADLDRNFKDNEQWYPHLGYPIVNGSTINFEMWQVSEKRYLEEMFEKVGQKGKITNSKGLLFPNPNFAIPDVDYAKIASEHLFFGFSGEFINSFFEATPGSEGLETPENGYGISVSDLTFLNELDSAKAVNRRWEFSKAQEQQDFRMLHRIGVLDNLQRIYLSRPRENKNVSIEERLSTMENLVRGAVNWNGTYFDQKFLNNNGGSLQTINKVSNMQKWSKNNPADKSYAFLMPMSISELEQSMAKLGETSLSNMQFRQIRTQDGWFSPPRITLPSPNGLYSRLPQQLGSDINLASTAGFKTNSQIQFEFKDISEINRITMQLTLGNNITFTILDEFGDPAVDEDGVQVAPITKQAPSRIRRENDTVSNLILGVKV